VWDTRSRSRLTAAPLAEQLRDLRIKNINFKLKHLFGYSSILFLICAGLSAKGPNFRIFFILQLMTLLSFWFIDIFDNLKVGKIKISFGSKAVLKDHSPKYFWSIVSLKGIVGLFLLGAILFFISFYFKLT
jgi:hypothetical protein